MSAAVDNVARRILEGAPAGSLIFTPDEHELYRTVFLRSPNHRPAVWTGRELIALDTLPVIVLDDPDHDAAP